MPAERMAIDFREDMARAVMASSDDTVACQRHAREEIFGAMMMMMMIWLAELADCASMEP